MKALEVSHLSAAPRHLLGDTELRVPARSYHPGGHLSEDGATLTLAMGWGLVEIEIDTWRQRAVYRNDAPAREISTLPSRLCTFRLPDEEHLELVAPDGVRSRLRLPANGANGARPMLSPTRADELYLLGLRTVTRWRCESGELRQMATFSSQGRHDFGDEIREVHFNPHGTRLYLRTDREVLALDALSLELQGVVFDINAHFGHPLAWVQAAKGFAMSVARRQVYLLLQLQKVWTSLLIECPLEGGEMRTLRGVDGVYFHTMSPVLPGDRLLLGGVFHGTALVDVKRMAWLAHAETIGGAFSWVDVEHARAHGFKQDGTFHSIEAGEKLRETTREGEIERHDMEWSERHLAVLSGQRGVELFVPPEASSRALPLPRQVSQLRLSRGGRWALFLHKSLLTVQDTWEGGSRELTLPLEQHCNVRSAGICKGVVWWWNERELCSERGRKIPVSKRASWGALQESPGGSRLLLRMSKELLVIDGLQGTILCRIPAPKYENSDFADEQTLVVVGNDGIRWYDATDGAVLHWHKRRLTDANAMALAVSPGGERIALALRGRTEVEIIPRDAPRESSRSVVGQGVHTLTFSPDGSMLAVSCEESPIRVFAVEELHKAPGATGKARRKTPGPRAGSS
ncbi:MAG: WD40 repeat domain-containing protein [Polyangiaceae bacterium]|jgi:hypothetical protein|nr:WD40 repeat domain-containing protein [Polyangiaceae bacterium]